MKGEEWTCVAGIRTTTQFAKRGEIATKLELLTTAVGFIPKAYSAQSSRVVELERTLAAKDAEIKRLKKFDVKFYGNLPPI